MLVCLIFTYFCYPEVKGRSPAVVDEMFAARLSARKFRGMLLLSAVRCSSFRLMNYSGYVSQLPLEKSAQDEKDAASQHEMSREVQYEGDSFKHA